MNVPFSLRIDGISGASSLIQNGWPTHVVSLVDNKTVARRIPKGNLRHHVGYLWDIETPLPGFPEQILPTRDHISSILDFARDIERGSRVLIHCHVGKSRSTAAAIGILVQHGMAPRDAVAHAYAVRPIMMPNRLIIRHMDEALGLDGELIMAVANHMQSLMDLLKF